MTPLRSRWLLQRQRPKVNQRCNIVTVGIISSAPPPRTRPCSGSLSRCNNCSGHLPMVPPPSPKNCSSPMILCESVLGGERGEDARLSPNARVCVRVYVSMGPKNTGLKRRPRSPPPLSCMRACARVSTCCRCCTCAGVLIECVLA